MFLRDLYKALFMEMLGYLILGWIKHMTHFNIKPLLFENSTFTMDVRARMLDVLNVDRNTSLVG